MGKHGGANVLIKLISAVRYTRLVPRGRELIVA